MLTAMSCQLTTPVYFATISPAVGLENNQNGLNAARFNRVLETSAQIPAHTP